MNPAYFYMAELVLRDKFHRADAISLCMKKYPDLTILDATKLFHEVINDHDRPTVSNDNFPKQAPMGISKKWMIIAGVALITTLGLASCVTTK